MYVCMYVRVIKQRCEYEDAEAVVFLVLLRQWRSSTVAVLNGCVTCGVLPRWVWTRFICVGLFRFSSTPLGIYGSAPYVRQVGFGGRVCILVPWRVRPQAVWNSALHPATWHLCIVR